MVGYWQCESATGGFSMSIYEKINIYVPTEVGTMLERDMEMF